MSLTFFLDPSLLLNLPFVPDLHEGKSQGNLSRFEIL